MHITSVIAFGVITLAASTADAKHYRYIGAHPLSADLFCYIEAPHVHARPPFKKVLFRVQDDHHYFVGDPVEYGDDHHERHVYHGHHPIDLDVVIGRPGREFCYIDGPHHHHFAPPRRARFEHRGGVYWYVGKMPRRYVREREVYAPINAEIHYTRPVVTIAPPRAYVDLRVGVPHVRTHVVAPSPRVHVVAPSPRVRVHHEPVYVERGRPRGKYEHKVEYKDGKYEEKLEYEDRHGKHEYKVEHKDGKSEYKFEHKGRGGDKYEYKREHKRERKRGRD
jgi:hypothetical protein